MIIDFHTHPLCRQASVRPELKEAIGRLWHGTSQTEAKNQVSTSLEALFSSKDADDIVREMDQHHVDVSVITGMDLTGAFGIELVTLEDLSNITQLHPNRFIPFAGIDPSQGCAAVEKAQRAASRFGCRGIKLHPELQNIDPSDRQFDPLWHACQENDLIVWSHASVQRTLPGADARLAHPMKFEPVAVRFRELKIVLGHCGFPWMMEALAMVYRHPNVYLDVSAHLSIYPYFPWQAFQDYSCGSKLLFATDSPFVGIDATLLALSKAGLDEDFHRKILGENAAALLNM